MKSLGIYYANQCDKNKCTSVKIFNKKEKISFPIIWLKKKEKIRHTSIVLTPYANFLLPIDRKIIEKKGITVLDCSWKQRDPILHQYFKNGRKLPKLLAGNPVNYGKWDILTSIEAVCAAMFITGFDNEALELLALLPWGKTFLDLNTELLKSYKTASSEESYQIIWSEFF